jgi:hypothetical protein
VSSTAKLHELLRYAESAGAGELAKAARGELIEVLLLVDPRKEKTLALAHRVRAAEERLIRSGIESGRTALLCQQFQLSRQYVHELLRLSGDSVDTSVIPSHPCT